MSELIPRIEMRQIQDDQDVRRFSDFTAAHPEFYEDTGFDQWLETKMVPRLESGQSAGVMVYGDRLEVAGALALYTDPAERSVEFKLFRVAGAYQQSGIGPLLFRAGEILGMRKLGLGPGDSADLQLDTRAENRSATTFFASRGCRAVGKAALYTPGVMDVRFSKDIRLPDNPGHALYRATM